MSQALPGALTLAFVIGLVDVLIARLGASDALPPNGLVGIRTRTTRRSAEAWYAAHRAAAPALRAGGIGGLGLAVVALVVTASGSSTGGGALALGGAAAALVGLGVGTARAQQAAGREG